MLDQMNEICEHEDRNYFEEKISAIDTSMTEHLYLRLNRALSSHWCGLVTLINYDKKIIGYEYETEDIDEMLLINEIRNDINAEIEGFRILM